MYYVGLDLGQKRDHTAVVVVERIDHRRAFMGSAFEMLVVRYVERMPLGMSYPAMVERVRTIMRCDELREKRRALAVDATGVGAPVVDMLRAARLGCDLSAVTITAAVKRDLMDGVAVLLETGKLKIGKLKEQGRLVKELVDMRVSMSGSGGVRMGAEGYGEHDDLVIALSLACWQAKGRQQIGERSQRLF